MPNPAVHIPVMLDEAVELLGVQDGDKIWIDATVGAGGHLREIIGRVGARGTVIGIDQDQEALAFAAQSVVPHSVVPHSEQSGGAPERESPQPGQPHVRLLHGNFCDIDRILSCAGIYSISGGVLADIGISSLQLDDSARGFSFMADGPLDMRMDTSGGRTAADIINNISEGELADILYKYGEERLSRRIAAKIVRSRPIRTTGQLRDVVASVVPRQHSSRRGAADKSHPATRTFQALRIAVNDELAALENFLSKSIKLLEPGARIVVISFHSLEDRLVKQIFKQFASPCLCPPRHPVCTCNKRPELKILTPKPLQPSEREILANPRSRSAKLRAGERV